jgi:hypothetical protein
MSVIVMAPVESHKSAVGISISLGKSNFVVMYRRWFGLVCRALFTGNESKVEHGGNIANNYLRISETFSIKYY